MFKINYQGVTKHFLFMYGEHSSGCKYNHMHMYVSKVKFFGSDGVGSCLCYNQMCMADL